jgi:hypothetical protein
MSTLVTILRLCGYLVTFILTCKIASIMNRWRIFYSQEDDFVEAWEGLKILIIRGRKETELLLSGDYARRVAMGYVFRDIAQFSEGQSYLYAYFRNRLKAAYDHTIAELEDRQLKRPIHQK